MDYQEFKVAVSSLAVEYFTQKKVLNQVDDAYRTFIEEILELNKTIFEINMKYGINIYIKNPKYAKKTSSISSERQQGPEQRRIQEE